MELGGQGLELVLMGLELGGERLELELFLGEELDVGGGSFLLLG